MFTRKLSFFLLIFYSFFLFNSSNAQVANAGPNQTICISNPNTIMAANTPTGTATGSWSLISGFGVIANPTLATTSIFGLTLGTNVFRWTIVDFPNPTTSSDMTITIEDAPSVSLAGPNQTLCSTIPSATMAANTPTVGNGFWTLNFGGGTITNSLLPNTTITGLPVGANIFAWTIQNAPCLPNSVSEVTIYVSNPPSISVAGANQTICSVPGIVTMNGNVPGIGTGVWSIVSGGGTIVSPTQNNTSINSVPIGTNVFAWTISNAPCPPSVSQMTVIVREKPNADAGLNQTLCVTSNTTVMAANQPTAPMTGLWSLVSGSGVIVTPSSYSTTINTLGTGTNIFQWTMINPPCGAGTSTVAIIINLLPTVANAGVNKIVCTVPGTTVMTGNNPAVGSGSWTLISGGGAITTPTSFISGITAIPSGSNVFRWTISNAPCPASVSNMTIIGRTQPTAVAGPNQTLCISSNTAIMAGNLPTPAPMTGAWSWISGPAPLATIVAPTLYTTAINTFTSGTHVYRWRLTNAPCPLSQVNMTVYVNPLPTVANAGANQTICSVPGSVTLGGNAPGVAPNTGSWTVFSGTATIANPTLNTSSVTAIAEGTNILRWTISTGTTCPPSVSDVTITVRAQPTAVAGPNQTLCISSNSAIMAANIPTPAPMSGAWTIISGGGAVVAPTIYTTAINTIPTGTNVYRWTLSNAPCPTSTNNITVFVNPLPTVANAGANSVICSSPGSITLGGNAPGAAPNTGSWTVISGTATIANSTLNTSSVTAIAVGTNVLRWSISTGTACPASTSDVTITVRALPTSVAGPNQTLCVSGNTAVMAANIPIPAPMSGLWTIISGGGAIVANTTYSTAINTIPTGTNVYRWTMSNAPCPTATSNITVFVNGLPSPVNAGPNQTLCATTTSAVMAATTVTMGVGSWSLISGSGTISNSLSPTTTITALASGTNIFQWTVSNSPCTASITTVAIYVNNPPNIAAAGPSQTVCITSNNALMAANNVTAGVGTWSLISGSGVITNSLLPNTTVTGVGLGANVFQWQIVNAPCPTSTSNVTITVNQVPTISNAGSNQTVCISNPTVNISGNFPLNGTGTWSLISGSGVITNSLLQNTSITGMGLGNNVFAWIISNSPCPASSSNITITVNNIPTVANAGSNQTLCITSPNAVMAANTATVGVGTWSLISGSGVISNSLLPNTAITGIGLGVNVFAWTISNPPCLASTSNVTVIVNQVPSVSNAGSNQTLCITSPNATMAANFPGVGAGTWSLISGSGIITNSLLPNTSITGLGLGVNVFAWTISNNPCSSSSSNVTLTVNNLATIANAGPSQTLCLDNANALMAANTATNGVGTWSVVSGSGVITNSLSPNTTISGIGLGINVFAWTITNPPCLPSTSNVTVIVNQVPTIANAGSNQTLCISNPSTTVTGNFPIVGTGTWSLISGSGVITNSLLVSTGITGLGLGPNVFAWTISNSPCAPSVSNVTITVNNIPSIASAGPNQTFCITGPNALMAANNATVGVGSWSLVSGSGVITNSLLPNTTITGLGLGVNVFAWTISNPPCSPSTSNVTLTVNDVPTIASAGSNQTLCTGSTATMAANTATVGVGTWSLISGSGAITNSLLPNTTITGLGLGANVFAWTITNAPCIASSSNVTITINQNPSIAAAGANQTLCITSPNALMAANNATVGVGSWSLVSGSGVITNSLLPNTSITGLGLGVNVFAWTISNNPCAPSTSNVTLTVNDVPTIASAGSNQTLCTGSTATMAANTATVGVGTWSLISGSGVITNSLLANTTITGLGVGANVFAWTITNAPCIASSANVTITINQNPSIANAGSNQILCITSPNALMAANTATIGVGTWSLVSGSGVITNSLLPNTSITGLGLGVNVFAWTISNNPCAPSTSNVTLTVNDVPTIASAGSNQNLCTGSTATMAANNATVGVGTWSLISGSGAITNSLLPNTTITGLGLGANVFAWTITNAPCIASSSNVTITINQNPSIAAAGANQTLCITSPNALMAANNATVGVGTWSLVSGSGVITNSLLPNTTITGLGLGVNVFVWTISNNPCSPSSSNVTLTVNGVPTIANAGSSQTLCTGSTATMTANTATVGVGTWSLISGSGVITNSLLPNTTITGLGIGANVFAWTITNAPCIASSANVTITINQNPSIAAAGANQTLCITSPNALMAANNATVGVGTWSLISGSGVITNSLLPNTTITGLGLGINVFAWTISNNPCSPSTSNVTITVNQVPTIASAGSNQTLCVSSPTAFMAANFPGTGSGAWTLISGTGVITNSLLPNTTITGLGLGTNVFAWTISNNPCAPSVSNVTIFINQAPSISSAGSNQTLCITAPNAFMAANTPTVGAGVWTLISGSGIITNSLLPNTSITGIGLGVNVFAWTISNAPCLASSSNVTVIVNSNPSPAIAGVNQTLCITNPNAVMAANFPGVGAGAWTLISGSGTITNSLSPTTNITALGLGTNVFAWTVSNAPCLPSVSNVTIFVNPAPSISAAGANQTLCITSPNAFMAANTATVGTGAWTLISGSGTISNSLSPVTSITGIGFGVNVFAWTISNAPCLASTSNVTIIVNPNPSPAVAGPNQTLCITNPNAVMAANFPGVGSGAWTLVSGSGVITNSLSPSTNITGLGLGTNVFAWTVSNAPCLPSVSSVTIYVNQIPSVSSAGPSQTICISSPNALMAANVPLNGSGTWSIVSGSGVITNSLLANTTVTGLGLGINVFAWTISNLPCISSVSNVTIIVNQVPTLSNAGPNQTICVGTPTTVMAANFPGVGAGTWSLISGTGVITSSLSPNTSVTGLGLGTNVFAWTIVNSPCAPSSSNMTITVNQVPTIANAGGNQTLCITSPTAILNANTPTVGVGTWSLILGSGTISNSLAPITSVSGLGLGTNVFAWTIANLPCNASTSNVTITVNDFPTVSNAGPNQTLCISSPTALMAANIPTVGAGTWSLISGSGIITNSAVPNTTITGLGLGVNVFAWTISNNPCLPSVSNVTINVNQVPTIANAGGNQTLCISNPTTVLSANTATVGVGSWSLIAGSGIISNSLSPITPITGLGLGVNVFAWTISNIPCSPSTSNVTITVNDIPTVSNAGPTQTLCFNVPNATLAANAATVGTGAWTFVSGSGVITNSLLPNSTVTGLGLGINILAWTISNPPCAASSSTMAIIVNPGPTISNAGPNQLLCITSPTVLMAANTATQGIGTWSLIAGSGVITNSLLPNTTVTGLGIGVNVFSWIINDLPCIPSASNVTITVNDVPTISNAGTNQTLCISSPTTIMAANAATIGVGTWSLISGSGTITNSLSPITSITGLGVGVNVFAWTIVNSPCNLSTSNVTIFVNQIPTVSNAGPNQALCFNVPNTIMAANTATVGVGSWSLILGSGTISNSLSPISSITGIGLGVNVFAWTISNAPCPASVSNMTIQVNPGPTIADAGPSQTLCAGTSATMAANTATLGTGSWSLISGSGIITNSLLPNTTITGLGLGINVFAWTISSNPCAASISNISITVNQIPSIANAGANQTLCISSPNALMAANSATVGVGTWSLIAGSGVITNSLLPNTTITGLGLGINVFAWIISNNPCAPTSSSVTLFVNDVPTIANAGANQTLCISNPTTMMAANFPIVGVGTWSLISGSGSITNSLSATTSITGLGLGANVFEWRISNAPCLPTTSNVTITVNDVPTIASAGPNQTLCITSPNTIMAANNATVGVGTWSLIAGSGVITNSLSPITSITGLGVGANVFAWTISNAPCLASTSNVTITLNNVPTIANAGVSQTLCITSPTALVSANTATVGVGTWSLISGSGVITNSLLPITTINGLGLGTNVFAWTITNPPCLASISNLSITVNDIPTVASAGPNQTVCLSNPIALMAANIPTAGVGTWSLISGSGVITNSLLPNTTLTNLGLGINIFAWTISNNPCIASTSNITITVNQDPSVANAGVNQTLCISSPTTIMTANTPTVGVGTWSLISGSGVIANPTLATTGVTGLGLGVNIFGWTISNAPCLPTTSNVTITVNNAPTIASAGSNQTVCISNPNAIMAANTATVGIGTWSLILGSGTISNSLAPNTFITNLGLGVNVFAWIITNAPCLASVSNVTIIVNDFPTVSNAGANQTLCITSPNASMAANLPGIGSGVWTLVAGSGVITNSLLPTTGITGLGLGANVFAWTISNNPCTPSSSNVTITVNDNPSIASAGPNQTVCISSPNTLMAANTATVGVGTWSLISGSGTITNSLSPITSITGIGLGVNVFAWIISNNPCISSTSNVTITVNDVPTVSNAGANQTLCISNPTTAMTANFPGVGTGAWTLVSGSGVITNSVSPVSGITGLGLGANVFAWTISNLPCAPSVSNVTLTVNQMPSIASAGANSVVCINNPTVTMAGNVPGVGIGAWSLVSGAGTITNPLQVNTTITGLGLGTNVFAWTISNPPCAASISNVTITVDDMPTPASAGPNQTICTISSTLNATVPVVGNSVWSVLVGGSTIVSPLSPISLVNTLMVGTNVLAWTTTNGVCPASVSTISIIVNPFPTPANAGPDFTVCATTATLNGNVPFVGNGIWTVTFGGATVTNSLVNNSGVTGLTLGNNTFVWTTGFGSCPNSFDAVNIFVDTNPSPSVAGPNQNICINNGTLNATVPVVGTGLWTMIVGGSTVTTPTLNNSTVTGLITGTNTFIWSVTNGVCPTSTSAVNIVVDQFPSNSLAGSDFTICSSTTTMNANAPLIGIGNWSVITGGSSVTTPTLNTSAVTSLSTGINNLAWTISNGSCPPSTSTVSVFVDAFPSAANAGPNQAFCLTTTTANLNALLPIVGTGTWSVISGGGTLGTATLNSSNVSGLTAGTNSLVWTTSNKTCPVSKDTMNIVLELLPTPSNAGPDQSICPLSTTLAANTPTIGNGVWSVISGSATVTNSLVNNSTVYGLSTQTNALVWTTTNGSCPPSRDTVLITILPPTPQALTTNDTTIYTTSVKIVGNTPPGVGSWQFVSGSYNITDGTLATTTLTGIRLGLNTIKWTITDVCGTTEDELNITLLEVDIPNAVSPNGDGKNDYFEIPISDAYTSVELKILNRWGGIVYEDRNYKNDWNGVNQGGQPLSEDTYFYIISLDGKHKTGYIILKR